MFLWVFTFFQEKVFDLWLQLILRILSEPEVDLAELIFLIEIQFCFLPIFLGLFTTAKYSRVIKKILSNQGGQKIMLRKLIMSLVYYWPLERILWKKTQTG